MAPQATKGSHLFKARLTEDEYRRLALKQWAEYEHDERARTNAGFLMLLVDRPKGRRR